MLGLADPYACTVQFLVSHLDQAVEMLASHSGQSQGDKMHFCMDNLGMDSTEYLESLNKASNGGLVKSALWNS